MKVFLGFCLTIAAALALAALLAYPLDLVLTPWIQASPHRIVHRTALLLIFLFGPLLLRRLGLLNRRTLGYALPAGRFFQMIGLGMLAGALIILPLLASLVALGVRVWDSDHWPMAAIQLIDRLALGLASGLTVAFIEETFFRGAMQSAITRTSGVGKAILLSSLLYAALHFMSGIYEPQSADWTMGFSVLAHSLDAFSQPGKMIDSFLALFAVGAVLALVRIRYDSIAPCIGMHAAWVALIKFSKKVTDENDTSNLAFLVGDYDGIIGWLAVLWLGALAIILWWTFKPDTTRVTARPQSSGR